MWVSLVIVSSALACVRAAVLDPALYLSPSPPLTTGSDSIPPGERWSMSAISRVTREAENVSEDPLPVTEKVETMENAETFWPRVRVNSYGMSPVHMPLTFSISGTYGGANPYGTGLIGSSYGSVSADEDDSKGFGQYGKSALAGSSYLSYGYPGVRIFGGNNKRGWSGWGNGKWGHYGKG